MGFCSVAIECIYKWTAHQLSSQSTKVKPKYNWNSYHHFALEMPKSQHSSPTGFWNVLRCQRTSFMLTVFWTNVISFKLFVFCTYMHNNTLSLIPCLHPRLQLCKLWLQIKSLVQGGSVLLSTFCLLFLLPLFVGVAPSSSFCSQKAKPRQWCQKWESSPSKCRLRLAPSSTQNEPSRFLLLNITKTCGHMMDILSDRRCY